MAVELIGAQHGITAAEQAELAAHPGTRVAWAKRAATLRQLVAGHNDAQARLAQVEWELANLPFARRRASSSPGG